MNNKKRRVPKAKGSDFARLVNLVGLEKRDTVVGTKVEFAIKRAIGCVLKPGQTPSNWIRLAIIEKLTREAEETG
jgi:hypothetical protein